MGIWPFRRWDCTERGHRWHLEKRRGYQRTDKWYRVAEYVEQERNVCRDCGLGQEWKTTYSMGLQGLGLSMSDRKKLDTEGFVRE